MNIDEIPVPQEPSFETDPPAGEPSGQASGPQPEDGRQSVPPPSQPQPVGFVQAGPPVRERRVGRVTLGISLVTAGVLLLIGLFNPGFSIFTAAKFAPVILILIGAEILVSTFTAKGCRLRYDFLSMFVCFLLIFGSFGLAMIPAAYQNIVVRERLETRLSDQIEEDVYRAAASEGITSVTCHLYLQGGLDTSFQEDMAYPEVENLLGGQYLTVYLDEDFESAAAFAEKAHRVLDCLTGLDLPGPQIEIVQNNGRIRLELHDAYQWEFSAEKLTGLCDSQEEYVNNEDESY